MFQSSSIRSYTERGKEIFSGSKYGYVLDISQAFYHIEIHPQFYRYLGFMWKDKYYLLEMLPIWSFFWTLALGQNSYSGSR